MCTMPNLWDSDFQDPNSHLTCSDGPGRQGSGTFFKTGAICHQPKPHLDIEFPTLIHIMGISLDMEIYSGAR